MIGVILAAALLQAPTTQPFPSYYWNFYTESREILPWFAFEEPTLQQEWGQFQKLRDEPYDLRVTARIEDREVTFATSSKYDPRFIAMAERLFWRCRADDIARHEMIRDLLSHCLGKPTEPDCRSADLDRDGDVDMDDVGKWQLWD